MTHIENIASVQRHPYKEIIMRGDLTTEVDAHVLAFYEVKLQGDDGLVHKFDAEIRKSPHGLQVDWYDDLDDYLFSLPSREEANRLKEDLSMAIYGAHELQSQGAS